MTSTFREFVRMNRHVFRGSKVGEDPKELLDGLDKVLSVIG